MAAYQPSSENLLINGDFSLDILDGGFDWVHRDVRGASLALDPTEMHSSSRSLRITLDGPGITDAGSLFYRNEEKLLAMSPDTHSYYVEQILPKKLALNLHYIESCTFSQDLVLIARTLRTVFE